MIIRNIKDIFLIQKLGIKNTFTAKLSNITRVIHDLNADILALQEVESQKALDAIINKNPQYKYHVFYKNKSFSNWTSTDK